MDSISWDYTELASTYDRRPDYAPEALNRLILFSHVQPGDKCCDMGAGTGRLTKWLLELGVTVDAIEPNDAMRAVGQKSTATYQTVQWIPATAEHSGLQNRTYALVTFGSSFNVTNKLAALRESARILRLGGWFACMWNHRDLNDPLQAEIESLIRKEVPGYTYGSRREDQTAIIQQCKLYGNVAFFEASIRQTINTEDWIKAWRSHATLSRQAGNRLPYILETIGNITRCQFPDLLEVPYVTRIWAAQSLMEQ